MTSTVSFLRGNLAPEGALVKSTAIDPTLLDADGVFAHEGPARVFGSEAAAMVAIKSRGPDALRQGEIVVLIGLGPAAGMPETYQVTSALKYLPKAKGVVLLTDGRFSGVSTGPCIGLMSPESWAGGPLGKLRDGDRLRVRIDTRKLEGSVNFIGTHATPELAAAELAARPVSEKLAPTPAVPADTDLWAALQSVSGGSWGYQLDTAVHEILHGLIMSEALFPMYKNPEGLPYSPPPVGQTFNGVSVVRTPG
jgi:dihydroxyacid dehydratase/phosphogluconate dehydratase